MAEQKERQVVHALKRETSEHAFVFNLLKHWIVPAFVPDVQCNVIIRNLARERLSGIPAATVLCTSAQWKAFYEERQPCLPDLLAQSRVSHVLHWYLRRKDIDITTNSLYVEDRCVMKSSAFVVTVRLGQTFLALHYVL